MSVHCHARYARQNIQSYTCSYCSLNCVEKLLRGVFSPERYGELCADLKDLTDSLVLALGLDGNERLQQMQKDVQHILAKLNDAAGFTVRGLTLVAG